VNTFRALSLAVVDRAGLPPPRYFNGLALANRLKTPTENCGVPRRMANLFDGENEFNTKEK
jgi:hypothetical protein